MNGIDDKCSETDLVNPELAHDNVMDSRGDLSPHIVVPTRVELKMNGTWRGKGSKAIRKKKYHSIFIAKMQLQVKIEVLN